MSPLLLVRMAIGSAPAVQAAGGSFQTNSASPTDALCQFRILNSGTFEADQGGGYATAGTWLLAGSASDYECRWAGTGDTGALILGNLNTWENLGTSRAWAIQDTGPVGLALTVSGPFEIGFAGQNSAIVTGTLTISAHESS